MKPKPTPKHPRTPARTTADERLLAKIFGRAKRGPAEIVPFKVSIDDGFVEWQFELLTKDSHSIDTIWEKICRAFKTSKSVGSIRTQSAIGIPPHAATGRGKGKKL